MEVPVVKTPLSIIALFVALIELFLAYPVTQLDGTERLLIVVFMTLFPFFVASVFFFILWHRPIHLYNPQDITPGLEDRYQADAVQANARMSALVIQNEQLQRENESLRTAPPTASFKLVEVPSEATRPEESQSASLKSLEKEARARLERAGTVDDASVQEVVRDLRQDLQENERRAHDLVAHTMSQFRDWLSTKGFSNLPGLPEIVIESPSYMNAHYTSGKAHFGGLMVDDPDVVAQIYFMSVLERIAPRSTTDDAGAMLVGMADYFACSYAGDPKLGERFAQASGMGMDSIRDLNRLVHVRDAADLWTRSLVWSGACWELRERLGADAVDEGVRVVITKVGRDTSIKEASLVLANELTQAMGDEARDAARDIFGKRGIVVDDRAADQGGHEISLRSEDKLAIPDNDPEGIESRLAVDQDGVLRDIRVDVDISHTWVGDLRIVLVSPTGREVVLRDRVGASANNIDEMFDVHEAPGLETLIQNEVPVKGEWALRVADLAKRDVGELNAWGLRLRTNLDGQAA